MQLILELLLIIIICYIAYISGVFKGAPFVPTKKTKVIDIIEAAKLKPGDKLVDLGSGDGRILIAAATHGIESHGYEINPLLILWSKYQIKKAGLSHMAFVHWKNFWFEDLSPYNVVTVFGITKIMERLGRKLKTELKPGSRIVSYVFPIPNLKEELANGMHVYQL